MVISLSGYTYYCNLFRLCYIGYIKRIHIIWSPFLIERYPSHFNTTVSMPALPRQLGFVGNN